VIAPEPRVAAPKDLRLPIAPKAAEPSKQATAPAPVPETGLLQVAFAVAAAAAA
jgi:hypothetical protein